ncbi:MAG: 3-hydroxyacyl-CoA dehydrogenase family protein, partial [Candidatus Obscuribacterales bacterium]|nr:3-hydroxyacyl-CoA dehydrogenase family protein [Candidatus Obscuribacterales bacterium]
NEGIEKGLEAEIDGFAKMAVSSIAKNMISVYFTREMAAQTAKRAMDKFGAIDSLGIIGSGSMGKGIAEIASQSGMDLLVRSSSKEKSQIEVERLKKRLSENCTDKMVKASDNFQDFANLDMVVESVYEDLELKKQIIEKVSRHMSKDAILATNTSSFSIKELAQFSEKPENLLGLHFFYPVDRMPLVEIIAHDKCSPAIEKKAIAFVGQLGKVPILVKDSPGFLVNRLLCAFLLEATRILDEGVPLNWIDSVATKFGMPMGPFELCDELGWGLTTSVAKLLHSKFGKRLEPPSLMERALAMGLDGKKTNAGCYYWEDSTRKIGLNDEFIKQAGVCMSDQLVDETSAIKIRDRLFLPMI